MSIATVTARPGRILGTVPTGLVLEGIADGLSLYSSATRHTGSSVVD